ncbi:MAG: phytanoyl-CoA dioxygenase family protein [Planctomycetota bacterium]|nr:phytanoyl-CoA dioxygenase family protein [Planctomycetota bacterium]
MSISNPSAVAFSEEKTSSILDEFNREGWVHIPGVLTPEEVSELRKGIDRMCTDPTARMMHHCDSDWSFVRLFERERIFRDMLVREPMISLGEAIVGANCHLIADGAVYNQPGKAISGWHVDDGLYFPLPNDMSRHDPRISIPNFIVNFQMMLTDVPSVEYGPTQVVPRSHYSGRQPISQDNPTFEGRGPVSILCKAGDLYLQHNQLWHRGAPNSSNRRRCLYQFAYGDRRIAQRFYPFLNYQVPAHVLEGADERLLRLFGKHPKGAYG